VEIVHQEADEAARAADVDAKIIRQVDDLVAYFNGLFQDDQLDIRWGRGAGQGSALAQNKQRKARN
jgi:hypothetical protein